MSSLKGNAPPSNELFSSIERAPLTGVETLTCNALVLLIPFGVLCLTPKFNCLDCVAVVEKANAVFDVPPFCVAEASPKSGVKVKNKKAIKFRRLVTRQSLYDGEVAGNVNSEFILISIVVTFLE